MSAFCQRKVTEKTSIRASMDHHFTGYLRRANTKLLYKCVYILPSMYVRTHFKRLYPIAERCAFETLSKTIIRWAGCACVQSAVRVKSKHRFQPVYVACCIETGMSTFLVPHGYKTWRESRRWVLCSTGSLLTFVSGRIFLFY